MSSVAGDAGDVDRHRIADEPRRARRDAIVAGIEPADDEPALAIGARAQRRRRHARHDHFGVRDGAAIGIDDSAGKARRADAEATEGTNDK